MFLVWYKYFNIIILILFKLWNEYYREMFLFNVYIIIIEMFYRL